MKIKVIGTGAAGNKATIGLIERNVIGMAAVKLINSTLTDIPENYRDIAICLSNSAGGCGKERNLSKELTMGSLQDGTLSPLDAFIEEDDELLIINTSTEGGTGSGSTSLIAKYAREVIGIPVMIFGFTGFEEDGRGLQNTIEFFQELEPEYIVQAISNKKCLDGYNKLKAHTMANEEFAKKIRVLTGIDLKDSDQNIDRTDLYKVGTTPGFMTILKAPLERIKNVEAFNKAVTEMIDNDKSLDISEPSAKRIAVILNVSEKTRDYIDFGFQVIKDKLGVPYEIFTHVQYDEDEEYIAVIASGMNLPMDELQDIYKKYQEASERVNKNKDKFFDMTSNLTGNAEDSMFNVNRKKPGGNTMTIDQNAKAAFFSNLKKGNEDPMDKF